MENKEFLIALITGIVSAASLLTAGTRTPDPTTILGKVYKVLEFLALNVGRAKDTGTKDDVK